ncbi:MAG TPA: sugar phosphate isomerase/epimerase [Gaiellaceae bacterium]|jgi:sugar phosphate isomerase/epimerase|nr:sugar phosphate isomerase/epimerase [Gaiellaceae bacterium]
MTRVALQLWTIRDEIERDLEGALRTLGELGYDGVELIHLPGHDRAQVRAWLYEAGLEVAGRHTSLEAVENELPELVEELRAYGTDRGAIAWIDPEALADPGPIVERFAAAAAAARDAGLRLGFHNHWSEVAPLAGGATFLDLLRELPPELLWLELDLGWVWHAGGDPIAELQATKGRCPLVHVKDYRSRESRDDVPIGDGVVGYERVIPAAIAAGAEWLIVEEDEVGPDPFGAVARSLEAVRRIVNG